MGWVSGIAVFVIVWWVVLFTMLPIGVRPPENPEEGHATSAPERPMLGKKFLWTTLISTVIWAGIYWAVTSDIYSFRDAPTPWE
ncbi:MAG: DUF1467 family protein [Alphaproteobacteria bacterium]|nr:DUF1467 family protein [Alphaproteobacteria bacterium]